MRNQNKEREDTGHAPDSPESPMSNSELTNKVSCLASSVLRNYQTGETGGFCYETKEN